MESVLEDITVKKLTREIPDEYVYIGTTIEFTTSNNTDNVFWTLKVGKASSVERVYCRYEETCIKGTCHFIGVTEAQVLTYTKSLYQPLVLGRRRVGQTEMFGRSESRQDAEEFGKGQALCYVPRTPLTKFCMKSKRKDYKMNEKGEENKEMMA